MAARRGLGRRGPRCAARRGRRAAGQGGPAIALGFGRRNDGVLRANELRHSSVSKLSWRNTSSISSVLIEFPASRGSATSASTCPSEGGTPGRCLCSSCSMGRTSSRRPVLQRRLAPAPGCARSRAEVVLVALGLVGIDHGGSERLTELSPFPGDGSDGEARRLPRLITSEIVPAVRERFAVRRDPAGTAIGGSSMGPRGALRSFPPRLTCSGPRSACRRAF